MDVFSNEMNGWSGVREAQIWERKVQNENGKMSSLLDIREEMLGKM